MPDDLSADIVKDGLEPDQYILSLASGEGDFIDHPCEYGYAETIVEMWAEICRLREQLTQAALTRTADSRHDRRDGLRQSPNTQSGETAA